MITQKDIAQRLGVSPSLVSRALAGTAGDIGAAAATIHRIRAEAERLNYHPSPAALSLRGVSTKTLGVIVKDFEDPYFGHLLGELQKLAQTQHYSLVVTGNEPGLDPTLLLKHHVDGVILTGSFFEPAGLDAFTLRGVPVVQIGCGEFRKGIARVFMDEEFGLKLLVTHLKKLGHRDIGYLGTTAPANVRREEILRPLLTPANPIVRVAGNELDAGYQAMQELLGTGRELPTALIAADDVIAQTALRALFEHRIRVPEEISLVGVDDIPSARMTIPSLTTLRQPIRELIQQAFQLLLNRSGQRWPREIVIRPELVIRESCAPPGGKR